MSALPAGVTQPWESKCKRCGERTLGAYDVGGRGMHVDIEPVLGGNLELKPLTVFFKAVEVKPDGSVEHYVRHVCPGAEPVSAPSSTAKNGGIVMPFGKHKGKSLEDVPSGYLRWALENADIRQPELRLAIERIVNDGDGEEQPF